MRKIIIGPAVLAAIVLLSGCASVPSAPSTAMELATVRQNVKIYDVMPQYGKPIEQLTATACDGTREIATDKLMSMTSRRGGNGLTQLSCTSEDISLSCWKSATCTAMAINVVEPPPPPPKKRAATPKAKKR